MYHKQYTTIKVIKNLDGREVERSKYIDIDPPESIIKVTTCELDLFKMEVTEYQLREITRGLALLSKERKKNRDSQRRRSEDNQKQPGYLGKNLKPVVKLQLC